MKKTISFVLATLAIAVVGCASVVPLQPMRGADVAAADVAPAIKSYSDKTPGVGEARLIARAFDGQPPMVPHAIDKYVPLTVEENACLDCHITQELRGQKVPQMGQSHFSKTARGSDGKPAVSMDRFQCDTCHVAQADAAPLVENRFVGLGK